ncbi:MAG: cytochrome c-type biogenesis protein [Alphaproteobacteria bacterium]
MHRVLALILSAFLVTPALGQSANEIRAKALFNELRCVVCAGQSIAESNAELAQDMRAQVEFLIEDNRSDAEIRDWFVSRYGDAVLMNPPLKQLTFALWYGPLFIFIFGLGITVLVLMRGRSRLKKD